VRVCSWQRSVRPTRSKRPISAWEPLIVSGGRELATDRPQLVRDALVYGGRYRGYPGALVGMKPPQFAAWMFARRTSLSLALRDVVETANSGPASTGSAAQEHNRALALCPAQGSTSP
jgi:hypothetical protein